MKQINYNDNATAFVGRLNENFSETQGGGDIVNVLEGEQNLFLGRFTMNGNWARQKDVVCPAYMGVTYNFHLPANIVAKVYYGSSASPSSASPNILDGGSFTMPGAANTQYIQFAGYENGNVVATTTPAIEALIASGEISVTYREELDIVGRTYYQGQLFAAAKRVDKGIQYTETINKAPLIAHISDLHGDSQRAYNAMQWCKHYGIDTLVVSGDSVLYSASNKASYVFAAAKEIGVHTCFAIGNHEVQSISGSSAVNFTSYLNDGAEDFGYLKASDTITDRGYYYHDFAEKSLRVIVLDQYDGGVYGGQGKGGRISQDQITFLINALNNIPAGYGVVIAMHSQEAAMTYPYSKWESDRASGYASSGFYVDEMRPIRTIVDAFISKGTCSGTYTQSYGGSTETVDIAADFSSRDADAEFICYLCGHRHRDFIGYVSGATNPQLCILVTCGNGNTRSSSSQYAFSGEDDLPRLGYGITQDAFNVYSIDRANKQVRIVRIGSDTNFNFKKRDYLVANYASTEIPT